eukprot:CAMPEP_0182948670 /NCGR_PEP_ID=MMETSP0105_2-20130417/59875_1 /TAXON_ID=81532 ORGANISM="Acanthoeca-like sp., Strain 10tr" /NCGR_SAMPLE_ID=MMETSP0105_2 /ASSEMBLY_ACC=CAM_ASM_000205 /LENGTH=554 /DNA_ID=CAMNT_0025088963 /DNA_START=39 /DNA_END=1703 /DNA_ORIENTATION=+
MYLLEAKKKAEKEFKAEQKKLEKQKKEEARRQRYAKKVEVKQQAKAAKQQAKHNKTSGGVKGVAKGGRISAGEEAARALAAAKERERLAKEKETRDMQEAIRRSKEEERIRNVKQMRSALSSTDESDYTDRIGEQVPKSGARDRVFTRVDNPNNNDEWSDVSINCAYVGTFEVGEAAKVNKSEVKRGINAMKDYIHGKRDATLIICLEGIKVIDAAAHKVAMAHALNRISMAAADSELPLFGFVAKNPGVNAKYCHVFYMKSRKHAESLQGYVMKAFRQAYTNRRLSERGGGAKAAAAKANVAHKAKHAGAAAAPRAPTSTAEPPKERVANRQWAKHNPLPAPHRAAPVSAAAAAPTRAPQKKRSEGPKPAVSPPPPAAMAAAPAAAAPPKKIGADYAAVPVRTEEDRSNEGLEAHAWFQAGIPREIAMELLEKEDEGSFVVRESSSQPGNFALTMKGGGLMHHFIIRKVRDGYVLGSEEQGQMPFRDLGTLIVAYAKNRGCLPCCLNLDSFNSVFDEDEGEGEGAAAGGAGEATQASFIDPDYQDMVELMKQI